jgi:hypothetical protein
MDDHIQFQGVKFEQLYLGVSPPTISQSMKLETSISSPWKKHGVKVEGHLSSLDDSNSKKKKQVDGGGGGGGEEDVVNGPLTLRLPTMLKREATCEVNGSIDSYQCFTVKLYHRHARGEVLLHGHYFRLFHPEANG